MPDSFVVEANRRVVGLAVRCRGGYRFFASDPEFRSLEHRVFRHARALAHVVGDFETGRTKGHRRPPDASLH